MNIRLPKVILGQDEAISSIWNAVAAWEFNKRSGLTEPLVLALTGPTGVSSI